MDAPTCTQRCHPYGRGVQRSGLSSLTGANKTMVVNITAALPEWEIQEIKAGSKRRRSSSRRSIGTLRRTHIPDEQRGLCPVQESAIDGLLQLRLVRRVHSGTIGYAYRISGADRQYRRAGRASKASDWSGLCRQLPKRRSRRPGSTAGATRRLCQPAGRSSTRMEQLPDRCAGRRDHRRSQWRRHREVHEHKSEPRPVCCGDPNLLVGLQSYSNYSYTTAFRNIRITTL